jgi:hypothetical protein
MTVFLSLMAVTGMIVWAGILGIVLLIWMEKHE